MSKKIKDEFIFIISAFVIGAIYFSSNQESSTLLWIQVVFVLTFAVRKSIGLIFSAFRYKDKQNLQHSPNKVTHISAKS